MKYLKKYAKLDPPPTLKKKHASKKVLGCLKKF